MVCNSCRRIRLDGGQAISRMAASETGRVGYRLRKPPSPHQVDRMRETEKTWTLSGESGVLALVAEGNLKYLENPSEPEREALDTLGDRLPDLRIVVIPPCSLRTIMAILQKGKHLRRLVIADNTPARLDAWRQVAHSIKDLPADILPLSNKSNERAASDLESHLLRYYEDFLLGKASVFAPARFKRLAPDLVEIIEQGTLNVQRGACTDAAHRQLRGWRGHVNAILNTAALPRSHAFAPSSRADIAVVVGAGPSLDDSAPELARLQIKALIVATDGSLNTLLAHGILPDLVASMDDTVRTWRYAVSNIERLSCVPLATTLRSNHVLIDGYPGPIAFFKDERSSIWHESLSTRLKPLTIGLCVGHTAFHLAELFAPRKIVMIGFDLGFRNGRFHPKDMPNPYYHEYTPPNLLEIESSDGSTITTELSMCFYLRYFEEAIAASAAEVVNATKGGAKIKGARLQSLFDALADGKGKSGLRIEPSDISQEDVSALRERLVSRLEGVRQETRARLSHACSRESFSIDDYALGWLTQEDDLYQLLSESGAYLQLVRHRELCRVTPKSELTALADSHHALLEALLEASDLLIETACARKVPHYPQNRLALIDVAREESCRGAPAREKASSFSVPASTPLPALLKIIRERESGTLLAENGGIFPDAWSIPRIGCVDMKTTCEPKEHERSLWIPGYEATAADASVLEFWRTLLPSDVRVREALQDEPAHIRQEETTSCQR